MSYLNNIPTAAQRLRDSQPQLLENFATNSALIGVDHIINPWTDPATGNQGKHNQVTLPEQADDPGTLADEMMIYTKAVAGVTQMFIQREGVAATTDGIDFTSAIAANSGETILPSGVRLKWGRGTTGGGGTLVFTFVGLGLTDFNTIFSVQATASTTAAAGNPAQQIVARVDAYSVTGMTVRTLRIQAAGGNPETADFTWFAIGN